ncbi:MAG: DUF2865 domain-containing protein [Alphaproteobacteria bacterium]|jgi:hypothetical protein|nr:DUF2865 domain-containing protein [Alphaproteobacteria bacterium]MBU1563290.1 DUF2865 domain-containing protein [Alphaproteobacteria bacterium]MBU2303309.1 DUF2865 domain-containing protein [Alphaproteobacteria bacterium]MBU2368557.1 DUF2865 domain-containing protein [Alphaproteobacteria bacterium]
MDSRTGLGRNGGRALILSVLAAICLIMDVNTAYAQAAQCAQLDNALRQFDSNAEFRQMGGNSQAARQAARDVQAMESRYVRDGCNDDAKAGRTLTNQCQQIGREVLRLREVAADVSRQVETANAVAGQREAILQEMARFGCGENRGSSATFTNERQSVFDRIFGTTSEGDFTDGQMVDGGDYWGYQGYQTVRTVCVRLSDGYFWPISYATLPDYASNDAMQCEASCPTTPVELYMYDNPGQEPEQMRNLFGEPYSALPTAFRYRDELDTSVSASCKVAPQSDGTMSVATGSDGSTRMMIEVAGVSFPLPLRDPRGQAPVQATVAPLETATLVDIPLPRRRPAGPGETPVTRPVQAAAETEMRLVQFGDKVVRVVGPDTPYARPAGAGT